MPTMGGRRWAVDESTRDSPITPIAHRPSPIALLLVLVDDLVIGFDDVFVRRLPGAGRTRLAGCRFGRTGIACWPGRALALRVEGLTCLAEGTVQVFLRRLDLVHVVATKRLPGALHRRVELGLEIR